MPIALATVEMYKSFDVLVATAFAMTQDTAKIIVNFLAPGGTIRIDLLVGTYKCL